MADRPPRLDEAFYRARTDLVACGVSHALVGGLAVTVRTRPRFTEDIDFALAVDTDEEAERVVHAMVGLGYQVEASVEQTMTGRLATARLSHPDQRAVTVDLLFSSSGIEKEIVSSATVLKVLGESLKVATVGHLIAMKVLSRDRRTRPNDEQDLVNLLSVARPEDLAHAREALILIDARGFARGKELLRDLDQLRATE